MSARFRNLLPLFLLILPTIAAAGLPGWAGDPGYVERTWTRKDGLPADVVSSILQSKAGYLWFGTNDGAVRFDGVLLRTFDAGNTPGLLLNRLYNIQEDLSGRVICWSEAPWIAILENGQFRTFGTEVGLPSLGVPDVLSDHEVIVASVEGAWRLENGAFHLVHPDLEKLRVERLRRARDGRLLLGVNGRGLLAFSNGVLSTLLDQTEPIEALLETRDGALLVSGPAGITRLWRGVATKETVPTPDFLAEEPSTGAVWAGGGRGLFRRDPASGAWQLVHDASCGALHVAGDGVVWAACDNMILKDGRIVHTAPAAVDALADDREGNVWFAASGHGVVCLSRAQAAILRDDSVANTVISDGRGGFWIAFNDKTVTHAGPDGIRTFPAGTAVRSLHLDPDGTLYAASYDGLFTLRGDRFEPVPGAEVAGRLHGVARTRTGDLWASGFRRVGRLSSDGWRVFTEKDGVAAGPMRFQAEGPDGSVWFSTPDGALRYANGTFRMFDEKDGLTSKRTRAIHVDERGVVWVGTEGRGIDRITFDASGGVSGVARIDERNGLYENGIKWIGGDTRGRLWITTNRGVFHVPRAEFDEVAAGRRPAVHCTVFDENSGMRSPDCNQIGVPSGDFSGDVAAFPTDRGLVVLPLDQGREGMPEAPLVIEAVLAGGEEYGTIPGSLTLPRNERNFEVDYTAIRFLSPGNQHFRYRLQGLDDHWTEVGPRRTAYFTHTPPGRYAFQVQVANQAGDWGGQEASLAIEVPALFHETPWFRGILAGLVVLLGVALYQVRLRNARSRERRLEALVVQRTAELERQAERLAELDQAKSRFFANVSHEFRTPLTLTIGPLEDLLSGLHGDFPPEVRRELKTAVDSSRSVLDLVNQILELAKLEAGRFRLKAREGDLGSTLSAMAAEFLPLAERRKIRLELDVPAEPIIAWFDELMIQRVIRNLLSNAFKFTLEGGVVGLALGRADGDLEIRVKDSGMGIPAEEQERIFDRFHQAESPMKSQPGTGIGLSLARELIDLHRGSISVESRVGEGTTFIVRLRTGRDHLRPVDLAGDESVENAPVPVPESMDLAAETVPGAVDEDVDRTTVLIVEDHPQVRALIRKHLTRRYRVLEAEDGAKGFELAVRHVPDLVVSDVMMPVMDGMDLTRKIKESPDISFIPILLLTARADLDDRLTAYSRGADAYLSKPFEPRELVARIDGLIQERRRLKERYTAMAPGLGLAGTTSSEEAYLASVAGVIMKNLSDEDFSVDTLAKKMGQTRTTLFRRLKEAGDTTPSALIRHLRLEHARLMLERGAGSVNEIAYGVGFKSVSHFCTAFRTTYGVSPGAWKKERDASGTAGTTPGS